MGIWCTPARTVISRSRVPDKKLEDDEMNVTKPVKLFFILIATAVVFATNAVAADGNQRNRSNSLSWPVRVAGRIKWPA